MKLYHVRFIHDWTSASSMEIKAVSPLRAIEDALIKANLVSTSLLGFEVREIVEEPQPPTSLFNADEPLIEPEDLRD
jgi:hypothetical protein